MSEITIDDVRQVVREENARLKAEVLSEVAELLDISTGSPELPSAMFQGASGVINAYALLTAEQKQKAEQGINPQISLMVWRQAARAAEQVRDGLNTIANMPKHASERLDALKIWQFMYDNPEQYGTEWRDLPGNEKPDDF